MSSILELPLIQKIRASFKTMVPLYLVGGAIRDHLMGMPVADVDLTCAHGIRTGRALADALGFALFIMDKERDICRLIETFEDGSKAHYDVSGYRGATIEEDLRGRDLTMNSIAYEIFTEQVLDPLGGVRDIREQVLKACSVMAIQDDPIRSLRAVRFANNYKFRVDADLLAQIQTHADLLALSSNERLRDEFVKLVTGPRPHIGLQLLEKFKLLPVILPDLLSLKGVEQSTPHVQEVWYHTLSVVKHARTILDLAASPYNEEEANADVINGLLVLKLGEHRSRLIEHYSVELTGERPRCEILMLSALFHDIEKPNAQTVDEDGRIRFIGHDALSAAWSRDWMTAYKFSNTEIDLVVTTVRDHMRFHALVSKKRAGKPITDRNIYRFFQNADGAGIDLVLLGLADTRGTSEHGLSHEYWRDALDVAAILLDGYFNRFSVVIEPACLFDGSELMRDFHLPPGPLIGKILARLKEEQASGTVQTLDAANRLVIEILNGERGD